MTAYRKFHPLNKEAAVPKVLLEGVKKALPHLMATAGGLGVGLHMGSKVYENGLPPVQALPRMTPPQYIQPQTQAD